MNSVEFLKLLARRWYVLLAGLALTAALSWLAAGPSTVYFTRTTVNVLLPDGGKDRIVGFNDPNQISVANVLAARVNGGVHTPLASDPDVTLPSMGILQGAHAQVRNVGGQWLSQVNEPVVDVQAVAATPQEARALLNAKVQDVTVQLNQMESQLKVPAKQHIDLTLNPKNPSVDQVMTQHSRALAGYFLAGLAATLWATWLFDRLMARRGAPRGGSSRRRTRGAVPATGARRAA